MIYAELAAVAAITVYVVGVSGFTTSWRRLLARALHIRETALRPLPPFDCAKCATFWACLIYAAAHRDLTLWTIAASAALSLLSIPMQDFLLFIREGLTALLRKLFDKLT